MRILLINQYAGAPSLGMEYRPHWMATEWQRLGHQVLVVTGDYSHLRRTQPAQGQSTVEGVDFLTLATPRYRENGVGRFVNIMAFRRQLNRSSKTLRDWQPDAVIASSTHPMDVRPCLRLARESKAVLVHEVHDLWPLTPMLIGGMSHRHPMIRWMQQEEDLACREADLVVSILPATLPYLESRGLDPSRWVYVSNGVSPEVAARAGDTPQDADVFRVGYFGSHGPANDLATLLAAARILKSADIEFHLWGSGPSKASLERQAKGLEKVYFHDSVEPDEARARMRSMDSLYVGALSSPLYEHGIGHNKIFEYMAAGRPIVQAIDTPASPADQAGCAFRCMPGNPEDVARALVDLAQLQSGRRSAMGESGRDYLLRHATYPRLAETFVTAISKQGPPVEVSH